MPESPIVVLTREHDDNLPLIERLNTLGVEALDYPCISTRINPYSGGEVCAGKKLEDFKVAAFTSRRGVAGMSKSAERLKKSKLLLAAVGHATADALEKVIGRKPDIIAADPQTGEALAQSIISRLKDPAGVLHVRGSKTTGSLKRVLEEKGFEVCELIVYESYSPEIKPLDLEGKIIAVFASPSAAKCFFDANHHLKKSIHCIAIGTVTAEYLRNKNILRVAVALRPDADHLLEAIMEVVKKGY